MWGYSLSFVICNLLAIFSCIDFIVNAIKFGSVSVRKPSPTTIGVVHGRELAMCGVDRESRWKSVNAKC